MRQNRKPDSEAKNKLVTAFDEKPKEHKAPEQKKPARQIWELAKDLGEGTEPVKAVADLEYQVGEMANSVNPANAMLTDLRDRLAPQEPLNSDQKTATELKEAEEHAKTAQQCATRAVELKLTIQEILTSAAEVKLPTRGRDEYREYLSKLQKARKARDDAAMKDLKVPLDELSKLASQTAVASEKLTTLKSEWQSQINKHKRDAADQIRKAQAIEEGKQTYGKGTMAMESAEADQLLDKAKALKLPVPDLAKYDGDAKSAAEKDDWIAAGKAAALLIKAVERLRRDIANTDSLKKNFDTAKQETNGKLKQLETLLSAANVHDRTILSALEDSLKKANAAASKGEWAEASKHIGDFEDGADDAKQLASDFGYYSSGKEPRLIKGTMLAVFGKLPNGSSNSDAVAKLEAAYQSQCSVRRDDWLIHLKIAGDNVKVGSDKDHYTTFNNSVPVGTDVSVAGRSVDQVCAALFEVALPHLRIHSTYVDDDGNRYHRYWSDGAAAYSANVINPNPWNRLDNRYDQMVKDMRDGVQQVIGVHGRIGANKGGPKI